MIFRVVLPFWGPILAAHKTDRKSYLFWRISSFVVFNGSSTICKAVDLGSGSLNSLGSSLTGPKLRSTIIFRLLFSPLTHFFFCWCGLARPIHRQYLIPSAWTRRLIILQPSGGSPCFSYPPRQSNCQLGLCSFASLSCELEGLLVCHPRSRRRGVRICTDFEDRRKFPADRKPLAIENTASRATCGLRNRNPRYS